METERKIIEHKSVCQRNINDYVTYGLLILESDSGGFQVRGLNFVKRFATLAKAQRYFNRIEEYTLI